jgi:hypothetical protein
MDCKCGFQSTGATTSSEQLSLCVRSEGQPSDSLHAELIEQIAHTPGHALMRTRGFVTTICQLPASGKPALFHHCSSSGLRWT